MSLKQKSQSYINRRGITQVEFSKRVGICSRRLFDILKTGKINKSDEVKLTEFFNQKENQ